MTETTYTMFIAGGGSPEEIVARGVTLPRALVVALEHDGAGRATIVRTDVGGLRHFAIGRRLAADGAFECATHTAVPRSDDPWFDADRAMEIFGQVLLQRSHELWRGRVLADEEFAARHVH